MDTNNQTPPRHRRSWVAAAALALGAGVLVAVNAGQGHGPGTSVESDAATRAALGAVADVFDRQLSGLQLGSAFDFARDLSAIRPEARASAGWPGADYAMLGAAKTPDAESRAVGMAFWLGGSGPVCAAASVDRTAARIVLSEVICPGEVPVDPVQSGKPGERAVALAQLLPADGQLATGDAPKSLRQVLAKGLRTRPAASRECSPGDLAAVFDSGNAAGNTDDHVLRVQNISDVPCLLRPVQALSVDQGSEVLTPGWSQAGGEVTLLPLESAVAHTSYRPHQVADAHQKITAQLPAGTLPIAAPHGTSGTTLAIADSSTITATEWNVVGYGVALGDKGESTVDIAAHCSPRQIAVTTPAPGQPSPDHGEPEPLPYRLINIGTATCRIDAGEFLPLGALPVLEIPSTTVLRPGNMAAVDIEGGAEDLSGTLTVDGVRLDLGAN